MNCVCISNSIRDQETEIAQWSWSMEITENWGLDERIDGGFGRRALGKVWDFEEFISAKLVRNFLINGNFQKQKDFGQIS